MTQARRCSFCMETDHDRRRCQKRLRFARYPDPFGAYAKAGDGMKAIQKELQALGEHDLAAQLGGLFSALGRAYWARRRREGTL